MSRLVAVVAVVLSTGCVSHKAAKAVAIAGGVTILAGLAMTVSGVAVSANEPPRDPYEHSFPGTGELLVVGGVMGIVFGAPIALGGLVAMSAMASAERARSKAEVCVGLADGEACAAGPVTGYCLDEICINPGLYVGPSSTAEPSARWR